MPVKKPGGAKPWVDPDDAPELTGDYFRRADVYEGDKLVRRGRPRLEKPKQSVKLRLSQEVIEHFRAGGEGWQTRINDTLLGAVKNGRRKAATAVRRAAIGSGGTKVAKGRG